MDVITKFLDKYSYRFPKGYPDLTDPADKKLMQELLSEVGISEAPETNDFSSRYRNILKKEAKLSDDILDKIEIEFLKRSNNGEDKEYLNIFKTNFRSKNIQDIKVIFEIFKEYVGISGEGSGKGEIATIIGVKDSKSGGKTEKDIQVGGDIYDVKELDNNGQFRTASGGFIATTGFNREYNYLMSLLRQLSDDRNEKPTKDKEINILISGLLKYYEGTYNKGQISTGELRKIKKVCASLKGLDLKTQPFYIKIGNKKFPIDQETHDKIQKGEKISNIDLGNPISDETSLLTKIKNHDWVKDPELLINSIDKIWYDFLDKNVKGLIILDKKGNVNLYNNEQLKDKFAPYRITQNQIIVKEKETGIIEEDLDEDEEYEF
jgi:hypothetical protein